MGSKKLQIPLPEEEIEVMGENALWAILVRNSPYPDPTYCLI